MRLFVRFFVFAVLLTLSQGARSQDFFSVAPATLKAEHPQPRLRNFSVLFLNEPGLRTHLRNAPLEFKGNNAGSVLLRIPLPGGNTEVFRMFESPVLDPAVAAQYPDIKTYSGAGTVAKSLTLRISLTSLGFNAILLNSATGETIYIERLQEKQFRNLYIAYTTADVLPLPLNTGTGNKSHCGVQPPNQATLSLRNSEANRTTLTGGTMRTFKIALSATGEFTQAKGGGTQAGGYAAVVEYLNRLIAVYRQELSVTFTLVSTQSTVYTDPATDPFVDQANHSQMLTENQTTLDNAVGNANYDVGHVLGYIAGSSSGGGIASANSACQTDSKGQGVSAVNTGDAGFPLVYGDQVFCHELGHQFGMNHTFNSSIPVCTTRNQPTSVEPGSGTTIMSYGYTCNDGTGNDDYENTYLPFLRFHAASYSEAVAYINTLSCFTSTSTGNTAPTIVTFSNNFTIPRSTPFMLTGTATDPDAGNTLTYSWEGTNIGDVAAPTPAVLLDDTKGPFFRSYEPVSTGVRMYPRLPAILNGTNTARGDKLPSVGVVTTHRFTVRDNVDGIATQAVTITVDGNSGPFLETTNLSGSYTANSTQTITWSVNNTTAPPVSCAAVNILLSADGGQTFPYILASATANDGSETVTMPNVNTTTARIKVEAANNVFFDISNSNFAISSTLPLQWLSLSGSITAQQQALLEWKVEEKGVARYEVEKSNDGNRFAGAGTLTSQGDGAHTYRFMESDVFKGTAYYRIRQIDYSGNAAYSSVIKLSHDAGGMISLYPNPVNDNLVINVPVSLLNTKVQLLSADGKTLQSVLIRSTAFNLNAGNLAKGVYLLQFANGKTERFIKD